MAKPENYDPVIGSCLCGAYGIAVTPSAERLVSVCHCTDCKKWTGSMSVVLFVGPETAFTVSGGDPATYASKGDSGAVVTRAFCQTCGSSLWAKNDRRPGIFMACAGLFPPSAVSEPVLELYTSSKAPWQPNIDSATQVEKMPR